jgi:pyridoxamine 5'-phosphate oxidase
MNHDPVKLFRSWLSRACAIEFEPYAFCLATVSQGTLGSMGQPLPDARMLLLKDFTDSGELVFFSSDRSPKGRQIHVNRNAAAVFFWPTLGRQVRVLGGIHLVPHALAEQFWQKRPPLSRFVTWVSRQSEPWPGAKQLVGWVAAALRRFPWRYSPPGWTGYALKAHTIEFLELKPARASFRTRFTRSWVDDIWYSERLMP